MAETSTYSKIKTKINVDSLEKIGARESLSRLSNAVCIENLVKKNSLFAPSRLQPMNFEKTMKPIYNLKVTKFKKQIEPHQPKVVIPYVGKSMSSLLSEPKPQLKQARHRRNISAIWQNKKVCRQKKIEGNQPPTTASFYLKKGDTPIFYELKMDIKKVDTVMRPLQTTEKKIARNKYRARNFPINCQRVSSKQLNFEQNKYQVSIEAKRSLEINQNKEIFTQTDLGSDKNSMPIKIHPKERYIKSTLISYSSKGKAKKTKQSSQIISNIYHIKNILGFTQLLNQQSIQIIQEQLYFVNGFDNNNLIEQLNMKSANCISVAHFNTQTHAITPLMMKDPHKRVEIASITKIMTCLLVLNIIRLFRLNIHQQKALVSQKASKMPGTSANLQYSDILTIYELLHALMLPSGNDAAVALAQWGGKCIRKFCSLAQKYSNTKAIETKSINFVSDLSRQKRSHMKLFIYHMNKAASVLKLKNTFFANAHGLMNQKAYSSSSDVSILTCIAMKNHIFAQIVGKKQFNCRIYNRTYSQFRNILWRNTNRLLNTEGFVGVKTGVTPSAGPCLSSMFNLNFHQSIVVVVLKTKSMQARFKQSLQLLRQSLSFLKVGSNDLLGKLVEDDQSTAISLENQKAQQANLIEEPKQTNSDPQNQEEEQDDQ